LRDCGASNATARGNFVALAFRSSSFVRVMLCQLAAPGLPHSNKSRRALTELLTSPHAYASFLLVMKLRAHTVRHHHHANPCPRWCD